MLPFDFKVILTHLSLSLSLFLFSSFCFLLLFSSFSFFFFFFLFFFFFFFFFFFSSLFFFFFFFSFFFFFFFFFFSPIFLPLSLSIYIYILIILIITGRTRFGSVRLRLEGGRPERFRFSVPAVPLQKSFFCFSSQFNRKGQQTRVYPYPLGAGSARPNPKMGSPDPENLYF